MIVALYFLCHLCTNHWSDPNPDHSKLLTAGFLLTYKLCERSESVFPLYLVDKGIPLKKMAVWNGMLRSVASVAGTGTE